MQSQGIKLTDLRSRFNKAPITILINGFRSPSTNIKTGPMLQCYFVPSGHHPVEAQKTGSDASVCHTCPQRHSTGGGCYVSPHGLLSLPTAIDNAALLGANDINTLPEVLSGRSIRIGAWGDPASVPVSVTKALVTATPHRTGYTHFPHRAPHLKHYVQASCDTLARSKQLQSKGWSTFRVSRAPETTMQPNEILCPHYTQGIQCIACRLCDGRSANVVAPIHGNRSKQYRTDAI